jgi:hypothetical protein
MSTLHKFSALQELSFDLHFHLQIQVSFVHSIGTTSISQPNDLKFCQLIVHSTKTTPDNTFGFISTSPKLQKLI